MARTPAMQAPWRVIVLATATLATLCGNACTHHVMRPEAQSVTLAAKEAADRFVRKNEAALNKFKLTFMRTEDHGDDIWVIYKLTRPDIVVMSHDTTTVAYNKRTGATRWVMQLT